MDRQGGGSQVGLYSAQRYDLIAVDLDPYGTGVGGRGAQCDVEPFAGLDPVILTVPTKRLPLPPKSQLLA